MSRGLALSEKYRPVRISGFLGLCKAKRILAGFAADPFSSAWLFHGPPGVGKTSMGITFANEITAQLHHIPARLCTFEMVDKVCRDCHYAPYRAEDWSPARFHVCLVDECDVMTGPARHLFLSKLDATECPPQTIFIFTSNSIETLEGRFLSRCRILEFAPDGMAPELSALLADIWAREALGQSAPDFEQIVNAAHGDVRAAINSLEMLIVSRRYAPGMARPAQKSARTNDSVASGNNQTRINSLNPMSTESPEQTAKGSIQQTTLANYDAARAALQEAHRIDEVKAIRNKAEAIRVYARLANDMEMQNWAVEIKIRAERRAGELIKEQQAAKVLDSGKGGDRKSDHRRDVATLKSLGISRDQSSKWQMLAAVTEVKFEQIIVSVVEKTKELTSTAVAREVRHLVRRTEADLHYRESIGKVNGFNSERCERRIGPFLCCTVICGDCIEIMNQMPANSIDLVVTSPPYNLRNSTGGGMRKGSSALWGNASLVDGYDGDLNDDVPYPQYVAWQRECLTAMMRLLKDDGAIFYNHKWRVQDGLLQDRHEIVENFPVRQIIIWQRAGGINFNVNYFLPTYEVIYLICNKGFRLAESNDPSHPTCGVGDIWRMNPDRNNDHPAPFPVALPLRCIESTDAQVILDPFMGSGTTAVAAEQLGKHWIGIEQSKQYCDYANERLRVARKTLFTATDANGTTGA
jgi:site-specific DNA-methyltransferase (adenine-specific)